MQQLKNILRDVKKNLDLYVALLISFIVIVIDVFGEPWPGVIEETILVILGLLAYSTIHIRSTMHKVRRSLNVIEARNGSRGGVQLYNRTGFDHPFQVDFADAEQIDLHSHSLIGLTASHSGFLLKKAQAGCKFRILLMDPESEAATVSARLTESKELLPEDIHRSIKRLEPILQTGNAELRLTTLPITCSLVISDPGQPHGKVQVELYAFDIPSDDQLHFVLTQTNNRSAYDFFRQQFEKYWAEATPYQPVIATLPVPRQVTTNNHHKKTNRSQSRVAK